MATALGQAADTPHVTKEIAPDDDRQIRPPACFQSDQRYFCKARCPWSHRCKKLIAEWLR